MFNANRQDEACELTTLQGLQGLPRLARVLASGNCHHGSVAKGMASFVATFTRLRHWCFLAQEVLPCSHLLTDQLPAVITRRTQHLAEASMQGIVCMVRVPS